MEHTSARVVHESRDFKSTDSSCVPSDEHFDIFYVNCTHVPTVLLHPPEGNHDDVSVTPNLVCSDSSGIEECDDTIHCSVIRHSKMGNAKEVVTRPEISCSISRKHVVDRVHHTLHT